MDTQNKTKEITQFSLSFFLLEYWNINFNNKHQQKKQFYLGFSRIYEII